MRDNTSDSAVTGGNFTNIVALAGPETTSDVMFMTKMLLSRPAKKIRWRPKLWTWLFLSHLRAHLHDTNFLFTTKCKVLYHLERHKQRGTTL